MNTTRYIHLFSLFHNLALNESSVPNNLRRSKRDFSLEGKVYLTKHPLTRIPVALARERRVPFLLPYQRLDQ